MNDQSKAPKRALVIRAGRVGDTVLNTTAIEPIRDFLGEQTQIDFIVSRGMRALFEHDSRISTIFEIDHRNIPLLFSPTKLSVLLKSFRHPYDLAVDLETGSHFASLMQHVRARQKISASNLPPESLAYRKMHNVKFIRYILSQVIPSQICQEAAPSLRIPENVDIASLIGNTNDYICLHPGNSLLAHGKPALRSWPKSHWRELIKLISHHLPDLQIVLIGEKSELPLSEEVSENLPGVINLVGRTSLQQFLAVLARCRVLVTTDTGPAHVAAALKTPVIALFGPSNVHHTGPFASKNGWVVAYMKDIECRPCTATERFKTCDDNICMQKISPSEIITLIDKAMTRLPNIPTIQVVS